MTRPRSTDRRRRTAHQIAIARAERTAVLELERLKRVSFSDIRTFFTETGDVRPLPELTAAAAACGASVTVRTQPAARGEGPLERVVTIQLGDKVAALAALLQRCARIC
jgi:phage terminase small subunit